MFEYALSPSKPQDLAWWFIFCEGQLLLLKSVASEPFPKFKALTELHLSPVSFQQYLGRWQSIDCYGVELASNSSIELPDIFEWLPLRNAALERLTDDQFAIASLAFQVLHWDKSHQFCSHCGTLLVQSLTERAKMCPQCQMQHYPRISPSIIVAIRHQQKILLARSPHFRPGVYSAIAGFIEPGENVEQAVHREVLEEVGIRLQNLRYQYSQSWPFPSTLMLGFLADYADGELKIDGIEIEAADWFDIDQLPLLPARISISRHLIDCMLNIIKATREK